MNAQDDWARWGDNWQRQPASDAAALQRRTRRKLRNMRIVVAVELLIALFAMTQLLCMLWQPDTSPIWTLWAAMSLALVASLTAMEMHIRRGTWRASSGSNRDLLQLDRRRALAGIRLAQWNTWGMLLLLAITLIAAAPYFDLQRWQRDVQFRVIVIVQFAANTPVVVATFAFCAWYARRQRRRVARIDALLHDDDECDGLSVDNAPS